MELFRFIFYLGVINIIFLSGWKIIATLVSSLLKDLGVHTDISFLFFKTCSYYFLVSITALTTVQHMSGTYTIAGIAYAITGTFVIYVSIAGNLERNRWRAVMNYERKRISVMKYDGYLLMACILLFIATLIYPAIADMQVHRWLLMTIEKIYNVPVLKYIIGFFAFFYMLNIIIRGMKASDEVLRLLFGIKKSRATHDNETATGEYTDYEEIAEEDRLQ